MKKKYNCIRKRIVSLMLMLSISTQIVSSNLVMAFGSEDVEEYKAINNLINIENSNDWDKYPEVWSKEQGEIFNNLFSDNDFIENKEGIMCVESAELYSLERIDNSQIGTLIEYYLDNTLYKNVKSFVVGIDYEVDEVTSSFYNGVNYRIVVTGEEDGEVKILSVMEAPEYILDSNNDDDNKSIAKKVITARKEGCIIDGNMEIVASDNAYYQPNDIYNETLEAVASDSRISWCGGFKSGYSYTTKFSLKYPSSIKVYESKEGEVYTINLPIYTKRVLTQEMTISTSEVEALKAQTVCIQQYAAWNTIYYSKYPNQGYDLTDTTADQSYGYAYDSLTEKYRNKVNSAYEAVKSICMIVKSTGALFETLYSKNKESKKTYGIAFFYQDSANKLAKDGKKYNEILHGFYNNGVLYPNSGSQKIEFKACHK